MHLNQCESCIISQQSKQILHHKPQSKQRLHHKPQSKQRLLHKPQTKQRLHHKAQSKQRLHHKPQSKPKLQYIKSKCCTTIIEKIASQNNQNIGKRQWVLEISTELINAPVFVWLVSRNAENRVHKVWLKRYGTIIKIITQSLMKCLTHTM